MPEIKDTIYFADPTKEGLDSDTDELYMPKGHSRYRLNCRSGSTSGENVGVIENVQGNVLVSHTWVVSPDAARQVIGSCEDVSNEHIYYWVWSDANDHSILRYEVPTNTITLILSDTELNLQLNSKLHNPKYVDGYLLWTDGVNPPRQINVEKAIQHTLLTPAGIESYGTITEQILDVIKHPPSCSPTIEYDSDPDRDYNNLRGYMYQTAYRYIYDDNSKSTWSPISKIGNPEYDELPDGSYIENQTVNNYIKISINSGTDEVKRIEIAVRDSNISDWNKIETLERYEQDGTVIIPSNTTYIYNFYNDKEGIVLDQADFVRPYDYVPILAGDQEILDEERLVYADNTEGYDNVELDATVLPRINSFNTASATTVNTVTTAAPYYGIFPQVPPLTPIRVQVSLPANNQATYQVTIGAVSGLLTVASWNTTQWKVVPPVDTVIVSYTSGADDTVSDIVDGLAEAIQNQMEILYASTPAQFAVNLGGGVLGISNSNYNFLAPDFTVTDVTSVTFETLPKVKNFKHGAYHQFGIIYYDRGNRSSFVNIDGIADDISSPTNTKGRIYVPYLPQTLPSTTSSLYYYYDMDWQIRHRPPIWATHWQWAYSKNQSVTSFLQYFIKNSASNIFRNADGNIEVALNDQINVNNEHLEKSIISTYSFNKGDRARFVYTRGSVGSIQHTLLSDYVDVEILNQDSTSFNIILPDFQPEQYGLMDDPSNYGFLIEVYTPRKEVVENQTFYEIGECYDVGNIGTSTRYHKGDVADQDPSNPSGIPAQGIINSGDTYVKLRFGIDGTSSVEYLYPLEAENYSDYYESDDYDIGRINIVNPDARQKRLSGYYRHSGRYIPLTRINNLFQFEVDDYDSVNIAYGAITAIRQIGFTLKILQEAKNTSQYISRTSLLDASGNPYLEKSEKVFGTKIVSTDEYGCHDAGSVTVNDRYMYFFDRNNGVYVRDSANGMEPISRYYMNKYWRDFADTLKTVTGGYDVYSQFDRKYGELNITIVPDARISPQPFDPVTIVFSEDTNRWKSFRSYIPEYYGSVGNTLVSFKSNSTLRAQLFVHNKGSDYNKFYNEEYNMVLDCYSNEQPKQNKVFKTLSYHSDGRFGCPVRGDIYILPNENYPFGMESRLKEGNFNALEGVYYGEFMNDMGDPRFSTELEALFEGRELRGLAMKIKLTNDDTSHKQISFVTIKSATSEFTD
jgi:hypothetical protein